MKNLISCTLFVLLGLLSCTTGVEQANEAAEPRECESTHTMVGRTSNFFEGNIYGISGQVTIVSDCEIEISNFFYNGAGPNVSIYAGRNGNYGRGVGINLSETINGQRFTGETLNLFLPQGVTFDDVNSFSVWCFEFDVDFSSANF